MEVEKGEDEKKRVRGRERGEVAGSQVHVIHDGFLHNRQLQT